MRIQIFYTTFTISLYVPQIKIDHVSTNLINLFYTFSYFTYLK